MTNTLHAHVSTATADCDGPMYRDFISTLNENEIAESENANGINDFSDIHFMNRVFTNHCGPYAVHQLTIKADDNGFVWNEQTEEGYRSGEVRWCRDNCDTDDYSQRDISAELMGY